MDMERRKRRGAPGNRRSKAGETLSETLVAMLIIGLSSVLFLTMIGASGRIFRKAEKKYEEIYDKISAADLQEGTPLDNSASIGKITIKGQDSIEFEVGWYGDPDYVLSYKVG